jgi:hypothetical protein
MWFNRKKDDSAKNPAPQTTPQPNTAQPQAGISQTTDGSTVTVSISTAPKDELAAKKKRNDKIIRLVSLLVSLATLGAAVYCVAVFFSDPTFNKTKSESYLCLTNKSVNDSKKVYDSFGTANSSLSNKLKIKDYGFVGTKMFVSETKIDKDIVLPATAEKAAGSGSSGMALYNVSASPHTSSQWKTDFASGKAYIDLSLLAEGDYLIYPYQTDQGENTSTIYPYSVSSETSISETLYTFKDASGKRKKIVFKNNAVSPYTLISVTQSGEKLPSGYYDAVLFSQEFLNDGSGNLYDIGTAPKTDLDSLKATADAINAKGNLKVTYVSSLSAASAIQSLKSVCLSSVLTDSYASFLTSDSNYKTQVLAGTSSLAGYDEYPEVREMTGYLEHAGEGYSGVTGNSLLAPVTTRLGKESYLVSNSTDRVSQVEAVLV